VASKYSPNSTGATITGITVCVTNTTGATWIAGRDCRLLISLSVPTPEARAVLAAHSTAVSTAPVLKSLAASFVAIPLHAKPQPAQKIVSPATLWFSTRSA